MDQSVLKSNNIPFEWQEMFILQNESAITSQVYFAGLYALVTQTNTVMALKLFFLLQ